MGALLGSTALVTLLDTRINFISDSGGETDGSQKLEPCFGWGKIKPLAAYSVILANTMIQKRASRPRT